VVKFHFTYSKLRKQPFLLKISQENGKFQNLGQGPLEERPPLQPSSDAHASDVIAQESLFGKASSRFQEFWPIVWNGTSLQYLLTSRSTSRATSVTNPRKIITRATQYAEKEKEKVICIAPTNFSYLLGLLMYINDFFASAANRNDVDLYIVCSTVATLFRFI